MAQISSFELKSYKIRYTPGLQCGFYFESGEFDHLDQDDIIEIIAANLNNNEGFKNAVEEEIGQTIDIKKDISEFDIRIVRENLTSSFNDGNHEGYNGVEFSILGETVEANWPVGTGDVQNSNCIASCGYIQVYEGMVKVRLEVGTYGDL